MLTNFVNMGRLDNLIQKKYGPSPRTTLDDGLNLLSQAHSDSFSSKLDTEVYQKGLKKVKEALDASPELLQIVREEYSPGLDKNGVYREGKLSNYHCLSSVENVVAEYQLLSDFEKMGYQITSADDSIYHSIINYGAKGLKLLEQRFTIQFDTERVAREAYNSIALSGSAFYQRAFDALGFVCQKGYKIDLKSLPKREQLEQFFEDSIAGRFGGLSDQNEILKYLLLLKDWGVDLVSGQTLSVLTKRLNTPLLSPKTPAEKLNFSNVKPKSLWERFKEGVAWLG